MQTLRDQFRQSAAYWGDRGDWLVAFAVTRDSDTIERSNFAVAGQALRALSEPADWPHDSAPVTIERASHWACGWVDYLIVHPDAAAAVALAESFRARVEDYPLLDEFHHSELEYEEASKVWRDCYRPSDRLTYIRRHRDQFDFRSFSDLLSCARGVYFSGYASELLS